MSLARNLLRADHFTAITAITAKTAICSKAAVTAANPLRVAAAAAVQNYSDGEPDALPPNVF